MLTKIVQKTGIANIVAALSQRISTGELTTLLLEVMRIKTSETKPHTLLAKYRENRFVKPAELDPILAKTAEIKILELFQKAGVQPLELAPVSVLGSCSAYGKVNQNNILSALRSCEVVADPSNILLLVMLNHLLENRDLDSLDCCASQRVLRTNYFQSPLFTPHFLLFNSAALIRSAEPEALIDKAFSHIQLTYRTYREIFGLQDLMLVIRKKRKKQDLFRKMVDKMALFEAIPFASDETPTSNYYEGFQAKWYFCQSGERIEIGDCGFVDWPRQIRNEKELHYFISGLGLELLLKMNLGTLEGVDADRRDSEDS